MIKKRIRTSVITLIIIIPLIISLPIVYFKFLSIFFSLFVINEWLNLINTKNNISKMPIFIFILMALYFLYLNVFFIYYILILNFIVWIVIAICIIFYSKLQDFFYIYNLNIFLGSLMFISFIISINIVRGEIISGVNFTGSIHILFFTLSIICISDISAYIFGKIYGKNKLTIKISPNKTWEGVFSALTITLIISILLCSLCNLTYKNTLMTTSINIITVIFSIFGDLYQSILKRLKNVKNSGNLLPGHGGLFDRTDSLLSGLPIYLFINIHI